MTTNPGKAPRGNGRPRSLPDHQPARALLVLGGYLAAVLLALAGLTLRADRPLVLLLGIGWSLLLLVPLAVLAPLPRDRLPGDQDHIPVLQRPRAPARPEHPAD